MARIKSREELLDAQKRLKTDEKIGAEFGVTRQAIHQLRAKFNVPTMWDKHSERNGKIMKLYDSGITGTKIAKDFGLSIAQTYRIIQKCQRA